jgi:hypothetical protein
MDWSVAPSGDEGVAVDPPLPAMCRVRVGRLMAEMPQREVGECDKGGCRDWWRWIAGEEWELIAVCEMRPKQSALEIGVGPVEPHRFIEAAKAQQVITTQGEAPSFQELSGGEATEDLRREGCFGANTDACEERTLCERTGRIAGARSV